MSTRCLMRLTIGLRPRKCRHQVTFDDGFVKVEGFGVIYAIEFPNGKRYIGQTCKPCHSRWKYYKGLCCRGQVKLHRALVKYGVDNCVFRIIDVCSDQLELNAAEKSAIVKFDSIKNGYNISNGGKNHTFTAEICAKISRTKKLMCRVKGHNWSGRHHTQQTKDKLRAIHLGSKGVPHTEEWKAQLSLRMRGKGNRFYGVPFFLGRKHREESKRNISYSKSNKWDVVGPDGKHHEVLNLKAFCRENGLNNSLMGAVSSGFRRHHRGWKCHKLL